MSCCARQYTPQQQYPRFAFLVATCSTRTESEVSGPHSMEPVNSVAMPRRWLFYAFACFVSWGVWAYLSKITSTRIGAAETQLLFTLGMIPFAVVFGLRAGVRSLVADKLGVVYGITNGLLTGLGTMMMFAALHIGPASAVTPIAGAFPLVTVLMARAFLAERLNHVQHLGLATAMVGLTLIAI